MADDRREKDDWLEGLRAKYGGPPPIPLDVAEERARRELGVEATAYPADYVYHEDGEPRLIPTTIVELANETTVQFFPKLPPGGPYGAGTKGGGSA